MGSVLPWLGEAVVPHFVSDIELMVRGLLVVVGFTTFCASLELLLCEGESRSQVLMQLFQVLVSRACERSGAGSERSVRNIVGARSGFLSKGRSDRSVSLLFRSNTTHTTSLGHAQIHLCLQQLTKLSAYTSKIVRCEGEMEFVKYFQKHTDRSYRCTIPVKKIDDNDVEHDQECGDTISVSKDSYFNLKRHIMRKHDSVLREHGEARAKREHFEYG